MNKPDVLSDKEIENEVDALCQSLLLHPMNLPTIKKIAIESITRLVGSYIQQAKAETARDIFEEIEKESANGRFGFDLANASWWQSLKSKYLQGEK